MGEKASQTAIATQPVWLVGIHKDAQFAVVARADSKQEAIEIAQILSNIGVGYIWKAEWVPKK